MTDVISEPETGATGVSAADTAAQPPLDGERPMEWAPMEPAPKKRRVGLWVAIGAGVLLLAAAGASMILIAPGTTIAGVAVGGMTPSMAADAVSSRLADTEITLTGAGDDTGIQGSALGAQVDAEALADTAFTERPMWNITTWNGTAITADVELDPTVAERTLRGAVPGSYVDPTDATVAFDADATQYVVTPAQSGTGISVDDLAAAFTKAAAAGRTSFSFPGDATEVTPQITDEKAASTAEQLNSMLETVGFYVGEERTVPVAKDVAASWLSVTAIDGELSISADARKIQSVVDTLPELVNREVVNATNIVDSAGTVLRELAPGADGRVLGDTADIASRFADDLAKGESAFELPVSSTPFESTSLFRRIEVDLSDQRTYLYENEKLVNSWSISSGLGATPTDKGRFRVYAHVRIQDMRGKDYLTKDVPWVTYYNGDEAFHGTYWHSNFGRPMSHGCVNMTISSAKFVWDWTAIGTEVWVHD